MPQCVPQVEPELGLEHHNNEQFSLNCDSLSPSAKHAVTTVQNPESSELPWTVSHLFSHTKTHSSTGTHLDYPHRFQFHLKINSANSSEGEHVLNCEALPVVLMGMIKNSDWKRKPQRLRTHTASNVTGSCIFKGSVLKSLCVSADTEILPPTSLSIQCLSELKLCDQHLKPRTYTCVVKAKYLSCQLDAF